MTSPKFSEIAGYAMSLIWIGFLIFPVMEILGTTVRPARRRGT